MTRALSILCALLLLLLMGAGWYAYAQRQALGAEAEKVSSLTSDLKQQARLTDVTTEALQARIKSATRIVTVTKEIERAIPNLVPDSTPPLPGGWRVQHDAAAQGVQLPEPAERANAPPVAASDAAVTVDRNYGACHDQDAAYQQLQQWLRGIRHAP